MRFNLNRLLGPLLAISTVGIPALFPIGAGLPWAGACAALGQQPLDDEEPLSEEPLADETPAEEPLPAEEPTPADDIPADDAPVEAEPPVDAPTPLPEEMPADEQPLEAEPSDVAPSEEPPASEPEEAADPPEPAPAPARLPAKRAAALPTGSKSKGPSRTIDAASLQGVHPGQTTRDELHEAWGPPERLEKIAGGARETYPFKPLGRVRVTVIEDVVEALSIQLDRPVAARVLAKQLEIDEIEPVEVYDERGGLLGQAYPERGVLFGYTPESDPPHVFQVVVEPVTAQTFLARAEARLEARYADCLDDLQQALELSPDSARAHWLHAELTRRVGEFDSALRSAAKALELEPKNPEFRLTLARVSFDAGDYPEAINQARTVAEKGDPDSLLVARAHCLWGDALAAHQRDYPQALKHHQQAIKIAEGLTGHELVAIRRGGKHLLLNAHLGMARDIGWGRWQQKAVVVPKWIERASGYAEDLMANEEASSLVRLRVLEGALAALAGVAEPPDAGKWTRGISQLGKQLVDEARDPAHKAHLAWRVAVALADGAEVEAARHLPERAVGLGKSALAMFELGEPAGKQTPTHDYVRGRLCYRIGAVYAIEWGDHKQAATWFDRAVPWLEAPVPSVAIDEGRQGETFVSIAVSYWEMDNRQEALRLTEQGVRLMERAVEGGVLDKTALAVPYGNLASMHEQLGDLQQAEKWSKLASRHEEQTTR